MGDGFDVTQRTREAWAGTDGWVLMVADENLEPHVCDQCQQNVAVQLLRGDVAVGFRPRP